MTRGRSQAQIIVWVAVMVPLIFLPIVGLSIDAGIVFDARRETQNLADGAARVGGMEIDQTRLRADGSVVLNPGNAYARAAEYLARLGVRPEDRQIYPSSSRITVVVDRRVQPSFLRLLHVQPLRISATSFAEPCSGIVQSTCDRGG